MPSGRVFTHRKKLYALETAVDLVSAQPENEVASSYDDDCDRYIIFICLCISLYVT